MASWSVIFENGPLVSTILEYGVVDWETVPPYRSRSETRYTERYRAFEYLKHTLQRVSKEIRRVVGPLVIYRNKCMHPRQMFRMP